MIYIGIDPGKSGGIAYVGSITSNDNGVYPMPSNEKDIKNIFVMLKGGEPKAKAIIEAVHAFPGQGVTSMFTFGQNYGFLRGCLVALSIPFSEVTPQKWMAYFGLKKKPAQTKKDFKYEILNKAQNLFPHSSVALQTADSLMIAEYLRLTDRS